MHLALGMVSALIHQLKTGEGQVVDSAMIDGTSMLMSFFYSFEQMNLWEDKRDSNFLDGAAHFYDTYRCADNKFLAIGSIEPDFYSILLEKLDIKDEIFQNQLDKSLWPKLKKKIAEVIILKDRNEWEKIFENTDGCVTPVLSISEAPRHQHNVNRNTFITFDDVLQPSPSPRFSKTKLNIKHNANEKGFDNNSIVEQFDLDPDAFN